MELKLKFGATGRKGSWREAEIQVNFVLNQTKRKADLYTCS